MTLLVAVKSCQHDRNRGCHQIIRQTWGRGADVRFFIGGTKAADLEEDETLFNCPDHLDALPLKVRAMCGWIIEHNYDHAFFCDNDTFLATRKLFACGYQLFDYAGKIDTICKVGETVSYTDCKGVLHPQCHPFASGGYGYFLSRKAMTIVANTEPSGPASWAEDLWVAQVLGPYIQSGELKGLNIPNFPRNMSWHFVKKPYHGYEPYNGWQEKLYKENS